MSAPEVFAVQRRLRLARVPDAEALQRVSNLPGVSRIEADGSRLTVAYNLLHAELAQLIEALAQEDIALSNRVPDRIRHMLLVYRDRNLHDQITMPGGWAAWLRAIHLAGAGTAPRPARSATLRRPRLWRRYQKHGK